MKLFIFFREINNRYEHWASITTYKKALILREINRFVKDGALDFHCKYICRHTSVCVIKMGNNQWLLITHVFLFSEEEKAPFKALTIHYISCCSHETSGQNQLHWLVTLIVLPNRTGPIPYCTVTVASVEVRGNTIELGFIRQFSSQCWWKFCSQQQWWGQFCSQ